MISKEQVLHIAKLARLELTEKELEKMQKDMSAILGYFDILQKADTKKVTPQTEFRALDKVLRKDVAESKATSIANNLVQAAPDKKDGYIKVKSIL